MKTANLFKWIQIETGKVTTLTEADSVEIIVKEQKKKSNQREISYTIGDQPQVHKINVRTTLMISEVKARIAFAHKGRPIVAIRCAGAEIDDDTPLDDWLVRISWQ
jgi:hypothetical protein